MGAMSWPCYIEHRIIVRRAIMRLLVHKCQNNSLSKTVAQFACNFVGPEKIA